MGKKNKENRPPRVATGSKAEETSSADKQFGRNFDDE